MELQFHRTKNWNLDDVVLVSYFIIVVAVVAGGGAIGGVLVEINDGEGYGE
jgi:hypothetical protein